MPTETVIHIAEWTRPGGGPPGYLFNLRLGLAQTSVTDVGVRSLIAQDTRTPDLSTHKARPSVLPPAIARLRSIAGEFRRWLTFDERLLPIVDGASDKILVFHEARLAASYFCGVRRNLVRRARGVYVMPHSPTDFSRERVDGWRADSNGGSHLMSVVEQQLRRIEISTYLEADGLIVPGRQCLFAYFESDLRARDSIARKPIHEVLSGVVSPKVTKARSSIRAELFGANTENKIIVGFLGRYNFHKGFDTFLAAARLVLEERYSNFLFFSAGTGPLRPTNTFKGYSDLGWRTDIGDILFATDVLVVPNLYSYFDLVIIEAMSLGIPVVTTTVGGGLIFAALSDGVVTVSPGATSELKDTIIKMGEDTFLRRHMSSANLSAYQTQFSIKVFARRHQILAQKLIQETKDRNHGF